MPKRSADLSYYRDKKILITGGLGYVGSAVISRLKSVACTIIVVDKQKRDLALCGAAAKISLREVDIQEQGIWNDLLKGVDCVFHFASQTSAKAADEDPFRDIKINLLPALHMIDTCQKNGFTPQIIFSGTVTEAGLTATYPVNEDFRDAPITVYDINKLAVEKYLYYYSRQPKRSALTLRLANVYGPGPESSSADRGVLNRMIQRAVRGEPITIYGQGDFVRDYIYIDDVARAFLTAGAGSGTGVLKESHYLIGSGRGATIKEAFTLARDLASAKTGKRSEIKHLPLPEGLSPIECRNFVADASRFSASTGWQPEVGLTQGIERTIDHYR
ncbi:NAD-dependent epimerase/dehydratase family protein [Candidatus Omnitrophota bacterium]